MFACLCTLSTLAATVISLGHSYDAQPPLQDQCHDINATEPSICPNHIGPPCPPCYANDLADYKAGDALNFSIASKQSMEQFMHFYIDWWSGNYPPSDMEHGYDIFTGSAGRALLHLRLYNHTLNQTYLAIATAYIVSAVSALPAQQTSPSFMKGHIGVWILAAIIEDANGNSQLAQTYLTHVLATFKSVEQGIQAGADSVDGMDLTQCALDEGLTGMLYAALFLNHYYRQPVIAVDTISTLTFYILDRGIQSGQALNSDFLQYECSFIPGCYLYGPGHGATGILHTVYAAYAQYPTALAAVFSNETYFNAIKNTLDFYVSIQLEDGNMPTNVQGSCEKYYGTDADARVQWCHGAPGFINVFSESARLFAGFNQTAADLYLQAAVITANVTFARGLLVKGTMYCHGIGGNINMLWEFAQQLNEMQHAKLNFTGQDLQFLMNQSLWRAKQMALWTLDWNNINHTRIYDSDENYSMYQGNFALPMTFIQMLSEGWPNDESACHPGWNLCV